MLDIARLGRNRLLGDITTSGRRTWPNHLPAQHMKKLRRGRRVANLDIMVQAQLQETLQPCRGMLGALPLVTVRQERNDERA